jgi:hypothetical protein
MQVEEGVFTQQLVPDLAGYKACPTLFSLVSTSFAMYNSTGVRWWVIIPKAKVAGVMVASWCPALQRTKHVCWSIVTALKFALK